VATGETLPDLSTIDDGRLDELAARHGVTVADVRRSMGPQQTGRSGNAAEGSATPIAAEDPVDPRAQARAVASEAPSDLEDGRLEDLAASLGLAIGDVRRMIEGGRPRRQWRHLDVEEIRRRYEAGASLAAVGAAMGVSYTAVRSAMIKAGIPRRPGPRPAGEVRGPLHRLDVDEIRRYWETGEGVVAIARAIGASQGGVRRAMDREGMERSRGRPRIGQPRTPDVTLSPA
jgi:hypothetical protein